MPKHESPQRINRPTGRHYSTQSGALPLLILTRSLGKTIRIGDDIEIVILQVKGNQVRVGVTAPPDISVHRDEVYQRIQAAQVPLS